MIDKCGEYLGEGVQRIVYEYKGREDLVIKFLKKPGTDHNRTEFDNWMKYKHTDRATWLAPCLYLSEDERFLVQKKVIPVDASPEEVPDWIKVLSDWDVGGADSKQWGSYEGRIVLSDYGVGAL